MPGHVNYVADAFGHYPDITDPLMYWLTRLEDGAGKLTQTISVDTSDSDWGLAPRCIGATAESPVTIQFRRYMADGVTPAVYCVENGINIGVKARQQGDEYPIAAFGTVDWDGVKVYAVSHYWKHAIFDLNGAIFIQYDTSNSYPLYTHFLADMIAGSPVISNVNFYDNKGVLDPSEVQPASRTDFDLMTITATIPGKTVKATWSSASDWVTDIRLNTTAAPVFPVSTDWIELAVNAAVHPTTKVKLYPAKTTIVEIDVPNNRFRTSALPNSSYTSGAFIISEGAILTGGKKVAASGMTITTERLPPEGNLYEIDFYGVQTVGAFNRTQYPALLRTGTAAARKDKGMCMLEFSSPGSKPKIFSAKWTAGVARIYSETAIFSEDDIGSLLETTGVIWSNGAHVVGYVSPTELITSVAPASSRVTGKKWTIAKIGAALTEDITVLGTTNPALPRAMIRMSNIGTADSVGPGKENWYGIGIRGVKDLTIRDVDQAEVWSDFFNILSAGSAYVGWDYYPENVLIKDCRGVGAGRHFFVIHGGNGVLVEGGEYHNSKHWYIDCESFAGARMLFHTFRDVLWGDKDLGAVQLKPGNTGKHEPGRNITATGTSGSNILTLDYPVYSGDTGSKVLHANIPQWTIVRKVISLYEVELSQPLTGNITNGNVLFYDPCVFAFLEFDNCRHAGPGGFAIVSPGDLEPSNSPGTYQQCWSWGKQYFFADSVAGATELTNVRLCDQYGTLQVNAPGGVRTDGKSWPLSNTAVWVRSPTAASRKIVRIPVNSGSIYQTDTSRMFAIRPIILGTVGDGLSAGTNKLLLDQPCVLTKTNIQYFVEIHPVWWWGFSYKNMRVYGNGEWGGNEAGYTGGSMPMIALNPRWDYVQVIDNAMPAQKKQSDGTASQYMVGWYRSNEYQTQGPPTAAKTVDVMATSWAVSGNYWPNAVDNQVTPVNTVTPVLAYSTVNPTTSGQRLQLQATVNPSDSAVLDGEPIVLRKSDKPYQSGGAGDLTPAGMGHYNGGAVWPTGPLLMEDNNYGPFVSQTESTLDTYYITAKYPGSLEYQYAVSANVAHVVGTATPTSVVVTTSPSGSGTTAQSVTVTVTASPSVTGTVALTSYLAGVPTSHGTQSLVANVATFTVGTLSAGTRLFSATLTPSSGSYIGSTGTVGFLAYSGSPPSAPTGTTTTQQVYVERTSARYLYNPPTGINEGQTVSIDVSVSPAVSGTITLTGVNGTTTTDYGSENCMGAATFQLGTLDHGNNELTAVFVPASPSYFGSSNLLTVNVDYQRDTTTTITTSPAADIGIVEGTPIEITVTVHSLEGGIPDGDIRLTDIMQDVGTRVLGGDHGPYGEWMSLVPTGEDGVLVWTGTVEHTDPAAEAGGHLLEAEYRPYDAAAEYDPGTQPFLYSDGSLGFTVHPAVPSKGWSAGPLNS
jgi:hypothetical protein